MTAAMSGRTAGWDQVVAEIYRADRGKVLASLIRLLGDFDTAEEALHDAFAAALAQWPERGLPDSPCRWLVSAGRFRAIARIRKRARLAGFSGPFWTAASTSRAARARTGMTPWSSAPRGRRRCCEVEPRAPLLPPLPELLLRWRCRWPD